jgi:hypothetical protein
MDPSVWGKSVWISMHYIALGYPNNPGETDKENYYNFFNNLHTVLPCQRCVDHLKDILERHPLKTTYLENSFKLFEWTVKIHNEVNKSLDKPVLTLSNATQLYAKKTPNKTFNMYHLFGVSAIIVIGMLFCVKKMKS